MISKEQILTATDEDLSRMAGEVLQPEVKHHVVNPASYTCRNCKKELYTYSGRGTKELHLDCSIPTPIPLTPANAFNWRDWAVDKYGKSTYLYMLCEAVTDMGAWTNHLPFLLIDGQPKHYIKAAMLCKEQSNE